MSGGWGGSREGAGRKPGDYEPPQEKVDLDRERAAHEKVKREQREFALARERGEYVSRASVQQASATILAILTQAVRSIPDNCERSLSLPPEAVEMIQTQCDTALQEAAASFQALAAPAAPR